VSCSSAQARIPLGLFEQAVAVALLLDHV